MSLFSITCVGHHERIILYLVEPPPVRLRLGRRNVGGYFVDKAGLRASVWLIANRPPLVIGEIYSPFPRLVNGFGPFDLKVHCTLLGPAGRGDTVVIL